MRRVTITAGDAQLWEKLALIAKLDPSIRRGLENVVLGHQVHERGRARGTLFRSGFKEVYEIDPGCCLHALR